MTTHDEEVKNHIHISDVVKILGVVVTIVIQLGALIWGAATISSSVDILEGAVNRLETSITTLSQSQAALAKELVEIKIDQVRIDERLDGIEGRKDGVK